MNYDRLPPQNLDAERAVLGAMLLNEDVIPLAAEVLPSEAAFYSEAHAMIYKAILYLHGQDRPADVVTVMQMLNTWGKLLKCGGPAYIADLSGCVPTSANVAHYAEIVRKSYMLRQWIEAIDNQAIQAYDLPEDPEGFLASSLEHLNQIAMGATRSKTTTPKDQKYALAAWLVKMKSLKDEVPGMTFGISKLDRILEYGLENDIVVIGGVPSSGKSSLLLNFIFNNGVRGKGGLLFSLEDNRDRIVRRMARLACPQEKFMALQTRGAKHARYELMEQYSAIVEDIPLLIRDDIQDIDKILHAARAAIAKHPWIMYVAIDYVQRVTVSGRHESELAKLNHIMQQLVNAKPWLYPRPIILASQLTVGRDVDPEQGPGYQAFKGSKNIGESADIAIVLHRLPAQEDPDNIRVRVTVGKQRDGPNIPTTLVFCKPMFLFTNEDGSRDIDPKQQELIGEDEVPF